MKHPTGALITTRTAPWSFGDWAVLVGDSIHNFCDGVLIAAAFLADPHLGMVTATAIIAHEIPQEVGDYIVLVNAGFTRMRALVYNMISGFAAVVGGVLGYFLIEPWQQYLPYMMVVAASSRRVGAAGVIRVRNGA